MRMIDADAINYQMLYKENYLQGTGHDAQAVWKSDIDKMPTIDAVPVVRCKDCKHFGGDCWCLWYEYGTDGCGYCHHGERKDDEHTD